MNKEDWITSDVILAIKTLTNVILATGFTRVSVNYLGAARFFGSDLDDVVLTPIAQDVMLQKIRSGETIND